MANKYPTAKIAWITSIFVLIGAAYPILSAIDAERTRYVRMVEVYETMGNILDTIAHKEGMYDDRIKTWEVKVDWLIAFVDSSGLSRKKFDRTEGLIENLNFALVGELDKHSYGGVSIYSSNNGRIFYYDRYLWPASFNSNEDRYIYIDLDGKMQYCEKD